MNNNEEFDFDIDYGKRKYSSVVKATAIVILILVAMSAVLKGVTMYITNSAADNYKSELKRKVNDSGDKTIYDIEDTFINEEVAEKAKYVKASPEKILYVDMEKAVIIYRDEEAAKEKIINWEVISVDYIITEDNDTYEISECYNSNKDLGENLDSCLNKDATYIISHYDKAIIEEDVFFSNYYIEEKKQI